MEFFGAYVLLQNDQNGITYLNFIASADHWKRWKGPIVQVQLSGNF